jgi:apolipoprotein D and lipocalin family protein
MKSLLFVFLVLLFSACSTKHPYLATTQKNVDIDRYMGSWYEIARFEHFFEKGCKNVIATYKKNSDNIITVENKCTKIESNKTKIANGVAYSTNKQNTKLKVSFFRPFYGDYWILDLDDNYSYALIGTPSREYFWILSRERTIDIKLKKKILEKLPKLGFDTNKLIWTIQE